MAAALSQLEPDERVALIEVYYHGRTAAEAAKMLGIAESTIRNYIYSALLTLRGILL